MKLAATVLAIALSLFTFQESHAVVVVDFTNPAAFSIQGLQTTVSYTLSSDGITLHNATPDQYLAVRLPSIIDSTYYNTYTLYATLTQAATPYEIQVFFQGGLSTFYNYVAYSDDMYSIGNVYPLFPANDFLNEPPDIMQIDFRFGLAEMPVELTLHRIEAIPEPSVYALSFLAAGGAYFILRRSVRGRSVRVTS